jgi:exosome complex exonuclease RRP6
MIQQPSARGSLSSDLMDASLYELVVDMIDMLLERANLNLDEIPSNMPNQTAIRETLAYDQKRIFQQTSSSLKKPQLDFLSDIDNSRTRPFLPKLRTKPNSHPNSPLDQTEHALDVTSEEQLTYLGPKTYHVHPYELEIKEFSKNIPVMRSDFEKIPNLKSQMPTAGLDSFPLEYIETRQHLFDMIQEIENVSEIAVDLEHHDYRTYQGLTCLMQVSELGHPAHPLIS